MNENSIPKFGIPKARPARPPDPTFDGEGLITPLQYTVVGLLLQGPKSGRQLRTLLKERGFDKSSPAFYQLMTRLEQAGFVDHAINDELVRQIAVKENIYSVTSDGTDAFHRTRDFYADVAASHSGGELAATAR